MSLHRLWYHGFVLLFSFTLNTTLPGYQQMVFSTCFFGFHSQKPGFDGHWMQSGCKSYGQATSNLEYWVSSQLSKATPDGSDTILLGRKFLKLFE